MMEHVLDSLAEILALDDEKSHQLGWVGTSRRHLCKVHVLVQQVLSKFILI